MGGELRAGVLYGHEPFDKSRQCGDGDGRGERECLRAALNRSEVILGQQRSIGVGRRFAQIYAQRHRRMALHERKNAFPVLGHGALHALDPPRGCVEAYGFETLRTCEALLFFPHEPA